LSSAATAGSGTLFAHRPFLFYIGVRSFSEFSQQIATVAVGFGAVGLSSKKLGRVSIAKSEPA
jgi:hypothetical protein